MTDITFADRQAAGLAALTSIAEGDHACTTPLPSVALEPLSSESQPASSGSSPWVSPSSALALSPFATASGGDAAPSTEFPVATYGGRRTVLLATILVAGFAAWTIWHALAVFKAFTGHGSPLATTYLVSFLLLWWIPVSWLDRPKRLTSRQQRQQNSLTVVVQIPVYNEDHAALTACLESVLAQTRLPNRVRVVDDGSAEPYDAIAEWFVAEAAAAGIDATWQVHAQNRGKRHAQMTGLEGDDSDVIVTVDSDSILDPRAIAEGLKPFTNPAVTSVAGLVAVLNTRTNWLTFITAMLYMPFSRGFRSAQSVLKSVLVNSGTLAFYRGRVIRKYATPYVNETFGGKVLQIGDDSMLTFYSLLEGETVHQPTCVAYTLVPETIGGYYRQQIRWQRSGFLRALWWFRYGRRTAPMFWMPLLEMTQLFLYLAIPFVLFTQPVFRHATFQIGVATLFVGAATSWLIALRFLLLRRSDEPEWLHLVLVAGAPLAGLWRFFVAKPMYLWALVTFWKLGAWGYRDKGVEVSLAVKS